MRHLCRGESSTSLVAMRATNYRTPAFLAYRQLLLKGNAVGTIAITAPLNDAPEIEAAGGVLVATGVGDVWPVAMFYSDGVTWRVLAQD